MRPVKVNQNLVLYYAKVIAPKKGANTPLNNLEQVVDKAIQSASKGDYKTYKTLEEILGKYKVMVAKTQK